MLVFCHHYKAQMLPKWWQNTEGKAMFDANDAAPAQSLLSNPAAPIHILKGIDFLILDFLPHTKTKNRIFSF
jgi:hypothetical protein